MIACRLFVVVLLFSLAVGRQDQQDSASHPRVSITQGELVGSIRTASTGKKFESFEGIPYARPPVGKRRFKEPQPPKPWKGLWDATEPGSICLQYAHYNPNGDRVLGEEDCLFVNVYRPVGVTAGKNLPVIVYIHGGAFMFGSSYLQGPDHMLDRNVVFASINYRVGPLGFLSTGDDVVPGNNGLKDQSLALRWIKDNIQQFGGDSNQITITGVSAGGASVHFHYLSPLSKGLFNRGISVSGCAITPWAMMENGLEKAQQIAARIGCPTNTNKELVDCLRNRPGRKVVEGSKLFQPWLYNPFTPFGAVVEKGGSKPFLSEHPVDIIKSKKVHDLPWIATAAQCEGLYPASEFVQPPGYLDELEEYWLEFAPYLLDYNYTIPQAEQNSVSEKIKEHYLKGKKITKATFPELIQMVGDRLYVVALEQAARLQAAANTAPVHFYRFAYRGKHSVSELFALDNENYGASHGDDSQYLLSGLGSSIETPADEKMQKLLIDFWEKYATDGNVQFGKVKWDAVEPGAKDFRYLKISGPEKYEIISEAELGHRSFWESIPFNENKNPIFVKDEL